MKRAFLFSLFLFVFGFFVWITARGASLWPDSPEKETPPPSEEITAIFEIEDAIYSAMEDTRRDTIFFWDDSITVVGTSISDDQQWGASILMPYNRETDTTPEKEPALVITIKVDDDWQVLFPNDPLWLGAIENAPDDLLSPAHKEVYINMNIVTAVNVPTTAIAGYLLPWDDGVQNQKYLTGSTCHDEYIPSGSGHYSFDFAYNRTMWDILAAKSGEVWVWDDSVPTCYEYTCAGDPEQDIGNYIVLRDTSTEPVTYQLYLHLKQDSIPDHIKVRGYPIAQGEYIGNVDNTGASYGSHLHFQVQVPYITNDYYWGWSTDITFDDVDVNGGRPRIHNSNYCLDFNFCDEPGDVCEESQLYYTSQNIRTGSEDSTPPEGDMLNPLTGEIYGETLNLEAWAQDLGDPGRDPIGLMSAQFIAFYDGAWRDVGTAFNTTHFSYDWDWCADDVPDGPVSVALSLRDYRGNQTPGLPGLRHVTKQYECNPDPQPPACQPAYNQVAVFSEINYQGNCQNLVIGSYADSTSFSIVGDNNTKSMMVGSGVQAELFTDANFTGRTEILRANDSNLSENVTASGTLSSLRVSTRTAAITAPSTPDNSGGPVTEDPSLPLVASATAPYSDTLEGDTSGWTADGLWHLSDAQSHSTSHSWRYGIDLSNNYDNGSAHSGSLTSEPITLPVSANPYVLQFWSRYQTESHYPHWDQRWLQISVDGGPFSNAFQLRGDPMDGWMKIRLDLVNLYGDMNAEHTIQVRYYFQTIDHRNNNYEGWFIDDIQIQAEPVVACPTDNHEANDYPAQASSLNYGDNRSAAICPGWDVDYYRFIGLEGERIFVDIDAKSVGSDLDSYLFLLDSDGTSELAENDDEELYVLLDPLLSYVLPRNGQYYLKMRAWNHPSGIGEYTLNFINDDQAPTVQLTFPTENGFLPQANPSIISVNASDAQSGVQVVEFYYHNNDWESSDWVALEIDSDGSGGWNAELDTSIFNEGDTISIYAKAFDRAGNWSPATAWQVQIDNTPPNIYLNPLDNPSESSALHLTWQASDNLAGIDNVSIEYQLNSGGWNHWLTTDQSEAWFVGQPANSYTFRATAQDRAGHTTTSGAVSSTIPVIGTLCSSPDAWDASASINDNQYQDATLIAVSESQAHNFCNPAASDRLNDQDWLKFEAESGAKYALITDPDGSSAAVEIRFYAADGTTLLAETSPTILGQSSILFWEPTQNQTIHVQLRHINGDVAGNGVTYWVRLVDEFVYLPLIFR